MRRSLGEDDAKLLLQKASPRRASDEPSVACRLAVHRVDSDSESSSGAVGFLAFVDEEPSRRRRAETVSPHPSLSQSGAMGFLNMVEDMRASANTTLPRTSANLRTTSSTDSIDTRSKDDKSGSGGAVGFLAYMDDDCQPSRGSPSPSRGHSATLPLHPFDPLHCAVEPENSIYLSYGENWFPNKHVRALVEEKVLSFFDKLSPVSYPEDASAWFKRSMSSKVQRACASWLNEMDSVFARLHKLRSRGWTLAEMFHCHLVMREEAMRPGDVRQMACLAQLYHDLGVTGQQCRYLEAARYFVSYVSCHELDPDGNIIGLAVNATLLHHFPFEGTGGYARIFQGRSTLLGSKYAALSPSVSPRSTSPPLERALYANEAHEGGDGGGGGGGGGGVGGDGTASAGMGSGDSMPLGDDPRPAGELRDSTRAKRFPTEEAHDEASPATKKKSRIGQGLRSVLRRTGRMRRSADPTGTSVGGPEQVSPGTSPVPAPTLYTPAPIRDPNSAGTEFDPKGEITLEKLVQRIIDWGEYDDQRIVSEVRSWSRLLKRKLANVSPGDILVANLRTEDSEDRVVFARFVRFVNPETVEVLITADERTLAALPVRMVAPLPEQMRTRLTPLPQLLSLVRQPLNEYTSSLTAFVTDAALNFLHEHLAVFDIDIRIELERSGRMLFHCHGNQARQPGVGNLTDLEGLLKRLGDICRDPPRHVIARVAAQTVSHRDRYAASLHARQATQCTTVISSLRRKINRILSGKEKHELTSWWHKLIHERVAEVLASNGFVDNVTSYDYINTPPLDWAGVKSNLALVSSMLQHLSHGGASSSSSSGGNASPASTGEASDAPADPYGLASVITELKETIYPRIEAFVKDAEAVLAQTLGIRGTLSVMADSSAIHAKLVHMVDDKRGEVCNLVKDVEYLLEMKYLEDNTHIKSPHIVPVSGLAVSRLVRIESEMRTVVEVWSPRLDPVFPLLDPAAAPIVSSLPARMSFTSPASPPARGKERPTNDDGDAALAPVVDPSCPSLDRSSTHTLTPTPPEGTAFPE